MAALAASMAAGDAEGTLAVLSAARADVRWIDPAADAGQLRELQHEVGRHAQHIAAQAAAGDAPAALASLYFLRTLCAHRHGPWGVNEWNGLIERQVHPAAGEQWFVGLPVMVTSNDAKLGLFNGDIGVVVHHNGQRRVAFSDANESAQSVRYFSPAQLGSTEPVHAMTIHKSQGSEFAQVVVVLPPAGSRLLTRELLYTAFTRARQSLTVVGTAAALRTAVATPVARASGLSQQLLQAALLEEPAPERGGSATQK
jgi:exodeoxyribonuclease V alpha subunit